MAGNEPRAEELPRPDARPALAAVLGLFDTTMIVMGSIIGAGVFNLPSQIAQKMGSTGGVLALWALGGVFAFTGALVFGELGGMMPKAGGQYVFMREAYGRFAAFLFGWVLLTAISSSALAFVAGVFSEHVEALARATGVSDGFGPRGLSILSVSLIVFVTALNVRGIRLGATVQNVAMLAKIAGILLVIALGALVALGLASPAASASAAPIVRAGSGGLAAAGAALLSVSFAYGGWQNVAAVAGEIKKPERNLPLGILLGTLGVIALYLALNAAVIGILGIDGVAASRTPTADAAGALFGWGRGLVAALVAISAFGFVQGLSMLAPRIYYAMAMDGVFFRGVGWVHPTWRTPAIAIGLQGAFAVLHVLSGKQLGALVELCILCDLVFFTSCGLALFVLRAKRPDAPRPYRALGYPWLPALFLGISLFAVVQGVFTANVGAAGDAAILFGAGIVLYFFWRRRAASGASA